MDYTMNGRVGRPMGNAHPTMAPHGCYRCQGEDSWVTIAVPSNEVWARFRRAIGDPAWAGEDRFADAASRWESQAELNPLIERWTIQRSPYEVMQALQNARVPAGPVLSVDEILVDPHLKERGFFELATHKEAGTHLYPGPSWKFNKTPLSIRMLGSCLGEYNSQILGGLLGLNEAEITELERQQIIGTEYLQAADQ